MSNEKENLKFPIGFNSMSLTTIAYNIQLKEQIKKELYEDIKKELYEDIKKELYEDIKKELHLKLYNELYEKIKELYDESFIHISKN
jgi:hypothetical protein